MNKERLVTLAKSILCTVCALVLVAILCVSISKTAPTVEAQAQENECAVIGNEYAIDGTVTECTVFGEVSICDTNGDVWVVIADSGLTCGDTVVLMLMDNGTTGKEDDEVVSVYNVTTHNVVQ